MSAVPTLPYLALNRVGTELFEDNVGAIVVITLGHNEGLQIAAHVIMEEICLLQFPMVACRATIAMAHGRVAEFLDRLKARRAPAGLAEERERKEIKLDARRLQNNKIC